jgi:3-dehydroquinate synthase|tara:strand:+ start:7079 stop:8116 length:1038 start_codon:yes stop_codon:yes gene_type:complete
MTNPTYYIDSIVNLESKITELNKTWTNIYLLVDENTKADCLPSVMEHVPFLKDANLLVLDSGEENKTLEICDSLWSSLIDTGADRKSLLINLGGGVITDMGGFVASTFKRGIDFIYIPTTLLGQVDAAIGGKTGVNLEYSKNQVGTFANPLFTFIDSQFLRTLPEREFMSGMGEVIKYGLIADKPLFELLKDKQSLIANLETIIKSSTDIKNQYVTTDFKEEGDRKKLNFGHTVGHAIESYYMGEVLHGEAIGAGMICESYISFKQGKITEQVLNEVNEMVFSFFDKIELEEKMLEPILNEMKADKKNVNGKLNFTLLTGIGTSEIDHFIEDEIAKDSLTYYFNL